MGLGYVWIGVYACQALPALTFALHRTCNNFEQCRTNRKGETMYHRKTYNTLGIQHQDLHRTITIQANTGYRRPQIMETLNQFRINTERLNTHSDFCVFCPLSLSTRHPWRVIVRADVYTCNRFSESVGSRFGGPRQKALPAMKEFTLLWIFA